VLESEVIFCALVIYAIYSTLRTTYLCQQVLVDEI